MFLSTILKPASLAGRLTVWYTITSTALFLGAITVIYFLTAAVLLNQVDEDLDEFNEIFREQTLDELWRQLQ